MEKDHPIIPMSSPDLGEAERQAVQEVLHTPNLSMGARIGQFEDSFRKLTGCKHAIGVNSGTAGLHLCVRAAGIHSSDLVLTTPFSFIASSNVLLYEQAVPVYVDVDARTGNIDPHLVEEAVNDLMEGGIKARRWLPRTGVRSDRPLKAILPVDVFGQPADMDAIMKTANRYQLQVIEDSCEALGAEYKHRPVGSLGHYGVFAFYPNKQITTGEGGMIVTNNDGAADLMGALRNQGRTVGDAWLEHTHLGYNYRLDEMSAALGAVQMTRLDELIEKRNRVANWYAERLAEIPGVETQVIEPFTTRMSWFVYVVRFAEGIDRNQLVGRLANAGIPARPYFAPIHLQPFMVERFGYRVGDFPVTEALGNRNLALPFSGVMSEAQVDTVCRTVHETIQ
jgi:dTDP-4-amino-4,6-dideoxygalactose transaminase